MTPELTGFVIAIPGERRPTDPFHDAIAWVGDGTPRKLETASVRLRQSRVNTGIRFVLTSQLATSFARKMRITR